MLLKPKRNLFEAEPIDIAASIVVSFYFHANGLFLSSVYDTLGKSMQHTAKFLFCTIAEVENLVELLISN